MTDQAPPATKPKRHRHVYDVDLFGGDPHVCRCGAVQAPSRPKPKQP